MAVTDTWIGKTSADWGASAANWSTGFPNSTNNVIVNTPTILTIGYSGGDAYVVNSLAVGNDFFVMTGGSLTILTTASFAEGFTQTGGVLSAGGAVTIAGAGTLTGGASEGNTAYSITGTIALANYTLGGSSVLNNAKTTNETGQITLGDNTGVNATINNKAGAVYNIAGDYGIGQGAATARFVNLGTFEKTGGSGTSLIDVNLSDTGAVIAATGTLEFRGPNDSFAGAVSGAGQFALGGDGSDTIASGAKITTGTFGIYDNGTVVTLGESLAYTGAFNLEQGSTLNLAGFTLTLSGTDTFNNEFSNSPVIDGSGILATAAGSDAAVNNFVLGGIVNWQNSGLVGETATLTIGDTSAHAATFTNEKGGVYNFAGDNGIALGTAAGSRFLNLAGATLEKTGGSGNSQIFVDVTDSGAIVVASGTIEFEGPTNSFAGPISGAGQFALGAGSSTIAAGTTIAAKTFGIYDNGTAVTLGENLSYAGTFNLEQGSTLNIAGFTLTLSGTDTFNNESTNTPVVDGNGTLVTAHGGSLSVGGFTLGGSVNWQNAGIVGNVGGMALGDASFNTATFTNETGGVYNFTNDNGIAIGAALDSSFVNLAGATLEKTGGSGTSIIGVDMTDSGAIAVATGTIEFAGIDNSFAGAISGAGQFALGHGSSDTLAAGAAITTKTFGIYDNATVVTLGENLSYGGTFNLEEGSALDLAGFTLTLFGADTFNNEGVNSPVIEGAGSLVTAHGGTVGLDNFTLGGTVHWQNAGTIVELGGLTIGDGSFDAASLTNASGGVYNLVNNSGIGIGAMPNSSLVNLAGGLFEKTGGTGNSQIALPFTNNGSVSIFTGAIEFQNTVAGAGGFTLRPGTFLQFDESVAAGSSVTFATTTGGDLDLIDSRQFGAAIHGFGGTNTDEIELHDINFSSSGFKLAYAGSTTSGTLTVTDGTDTAHFEMFGNYTTANFHASSDPSGGTRIFDPPVSHPLLAVHTV